MEHSSISASVVGNRDGFGMNVPIGGLNWKNLVSANSSSSNFDVSFIPYEDNKVVFSDKEVDDGSKDWDLALVGYALGKRPFFDSLRQSLGKIWKLRGSFEVNSLSDGFFIFKFTCIEDIDYVLSGGPWFIMGKPFFFKRWNVDFKPIRDEFDAIPIWVKFFNIPLFCYNPIGISKIASRIGNPLIVDSLTAKGARLTFARVNIEVKIDSDLPDFVVINFNNKDLSIPVQYDWKPMPCKDCHTFSHNPFNCPRVKHDNAVFDKRSRGAYRIFKNRVLEDCANLNDINVDNVPIVITSNASDKHGKSVIEDLNFPVNVQLGVDEINANENFSSHINACYEDTASHSIPVSIDVVEAIGINMGSNAVDVPLVNNSSSVSPNSGVNVARNPIAQLVDPLNIIDDNDARLVKLISDLDVSKVTLKNMVNDISGSSSINVGIKNPLPSSRARKGKHK